MKGRWRGPLHGIPVGLKDLFDTAGVRTTGASALFADRIPTEDAEVVRRLKAAGAVIVGKQNMHEFALGATSAASHFGPVHNPWNRDYVAGGSSGGSAAAVAASLCYGALGSDTGGSVRIPASFCSIVGLKPTYGRVSARGVIPLSWSLDHVGVLTRTVLDGAVLLQAIAGYDAQEVTSVDRPVPSYAAAVKRGASSLRIGVPRENFFAALHPDVEKASRAGDRPPVQAVRGCAGGRYTGESRRERDRSDGGSLCVSCGTNTGSPATVSATRVGTSAPWAGRRYDDVYRAASGVGSDASSSDGIVRASRSARDTDGTPACRSRSPRRRTTTPAWLCLRATRDRSMCTVCPQYRYPAASRKTARRSVCRSSVRPGERSLSSASLTRLNRQLTGGHDARHCDALDWPERGLVGFVWKAHSNGSDFLMPPEYGPVAWPTRSQSGGCSLFG